MLFQERTRAFLQQHGLGHEPQVHALDLVSEVGEIAKALLETSAYGQAPFATSAALAAEMGDAFFSLIALAESLGVDLETALASALDKYESRIATRGHCGSRERATPGTARLPANPTSN